MDKIAVIGSGQMVANIECKNTLGAPQAFAMENLRWQMVSGINVKALDTTYPGQAIVSQDDPAKPSSAAVIATARVKPIPSVEQPDIPADLPYREMTGSSVFKWLQAYDIVELRVV